MNSYYCQPCPPTKICDCLPNCVLPITASCPCGDTEGPVLLSQGWLSLKACELVSAALGAGSFCFCLNYLSGVPACCTSSDGSVGSGFNYGQNAQIAAGSLILQTGENTQETFSPIAGGGYSSIGNNSSAVLTRTGLGTSTDQITITSRDGTVSQFYGLNPSIPTPGKIKSLTDRFGNTQSFNWTAIGGKVRLLSVTDSYGRVSRFTYDPCQNYLMTQVQDFDGRLVTLHYDDAGRLVAVVGPAITRGADDNTNVYPNGTATVYEYDVNNSRPERQNDLISIYEPNQVAPYLNSDRVVDVAAVYANATARRKITYYNDPTDTFTYGKVQQVIESTSESAAIGSGAWGYIYVNSGLPANLINPTDQIVSRTYVTDRNGNQTAYDFNATQVVVRKEAFATRAKNSLQAANWITWTKYNSHNQPLLVVMPEGNSVAYSYEDETNTITFGGVPYARRIGLLKSVTRFPGNTIGIASRAGSNGQTQLTETYFHDPIFNEVCGSIEVRGNPVNGSRTYFTPQNGGTTPTNADKSRYATISYFDYQKDTTALVQADTALQAQLGLTSTQIGQLITFVNNQMTATDGTGGIPAGFAMGIGDVNGEGTGNGTSFNARHQGAVVKVQHPSVRQLVPNTGGGDPWAWSTQSRIELFTSNARGQQTTATDPEGNLTVYVRYPENDPEGAGQFLVPTLSNQQYGFMKEIHADADPNTVMSIVGGDGDMITFSGNKISRTNTPGVYQDLVTKYQSSSTSAGCTSCAYDPLGNPLSMTDPRGFTTTYSRNELGEVYRTTTDAPYDYQKETSFDANRNVIQVDTLDVGVQYESTDIADANYAKFIPTGSGSVANLPVTAGPGGSVRPGWFSNLYMFDMLDNKIEDDIDATGSVPSSLVTTYAYDFNQNLITITKPQGNLVEYDYDERDLRIATRVGYDPATSQPGAITVMAYDGNGNMIDAIGPIQRGTSSQSLSVVIDDAFRSGSALTHVGDWVTANTYDGFDRLIQSTDAVGGINANTFDPGGCVIATQSNGTTGGFTPTDRSGSRNLPLSSSGTNFDEAGRAYEQLQNVFLNTAISGSTPVHTLPSSRTVTHTGGGLATNSTANNHTGTVTLTTGGSSYILSRAVFDRTSRTTNTATDNGAITSYAYDGVNRQVSMTDALGNQVLNTFDGNGNVVASTRLEVCTIPGVTSVESFASQMRYDLLNRLVVTIQQGPDGNLNPTLPIGGDEPETANLTLYTLYGYDSRGNRTNLIDPKQNTTVWTYDGASRQLENERQLRNNGDGTHSIFDTVVTTNSYDGNSRLIRLIDDNGGTTTWTYDTLDRQTVMTFHDGSTRTSTYDLASDLAGYVDENGSVFANTFDVLGRKTAVAITPAANVVGTTNQYFQYDGLSRMTWSQDIAGSFTDAPMAFDSLGRVIEEEPNFHGDIRYITHDAWTSLAATSLTYPNGRQVASGYDVLYRRNAVNETSGGASIAQWQFFGGRTATVALGNGITTSLMNDAQTASAIQSGGTYPPTWGDNTTDRLGYDGSGRMIAKRFLPSGSTTCVVGFTTQFDPSSNKLYERALHAESRSALYPAYDSMDRLLQYQRGVLASGGGTSTTPITLPGTDTNRLYNLDGLGNWTNTVYTPEGGSPTTEIRQHNKLNEITQFATRSVTYDHGNNAGNSNPLIAQRGNGNIANDGTRIYAYDALNRLIMINSTATGTPQVAAYTYDALGRRVLKTVTNGGIPGGIANVTYRYLYDSQQIVEELLVGGMTTTLRQFIWGQYIDELVQLTAASPLTAGTYYPLQDLLYRATATTKSDGSIFEAYDYDAYGNTLMFSAAGSGGNWWADNATATLQPMCEFLFTGRQYDPETEIYWNRARHYYPPLGRFIGRDPMDYESSTNMYEYCGSAAVGCLDPLGLQTVDPNEKTIQGYMEVYGLNHDEATKAYYDDLTKSLKRHLTYYQPPSFCAICHGSLDGRYVDLTKPYLDPRTPSREQLSWATSVSGTVPQKWMRPSGRTLSYILTAGVDSNPTPAQLGASMNAFSSKVGAQWDCYSCCMKGKLLIVVGAGAGLGAAPDLPAFYKPITYPFLDPGNYEKYVGTGPWGTLRIGAAAIAGNMGWNATYRALMAGRGLSAVRAGGSRIWAFGARGAVRGGIAGLALLSIYCSAKCLREGME